ncbi:hypothetical protein [Roseovarius sp. D22-M7]|uniref:hypothetical protein n=1 Tax=Roseovarius sp. D22-M7 TaxID=3127116 RepID=UPI00301025E4
MAWVTFPDRVTATTHDTLHFLVFLSYHAPVSDGVQRIGSWAIADAVDAVLKEGLGVVAVAFERWCVLSKLVRDGLRATA